MGRRKLAHAELAAAPAAIKADYYMTALKSRPTNLVLGRRHYGQTINQTSKHPLLAYVFRLDG